MTIDNDDGEDDDDDDDEEMKMKMIKMIKVKMKNDEGRVMTLGVNIGIIGEREGAMDGRYCCCLMLFPSSSRHRLPPPAYSVPPYRPPPTLQCPPPIAKAPRLIISYLLYSMGKSKIEYFVIITIAICENSIRVYK
ncbi:hypothetical protein BU24DRAFT_422648 [Aaosphaeria arxii CBS 175.79]|uniref:Uncharacterized protein n=1 Tax=Aaosphaeria arxii CBS 175.79 TaxID=1450172 RepID=A0A6A5XTM3_9PLEO|nr:uncharacterized protein BU24DRAFT_422648 [Aaosphaeria arxii CBS 175.79]KAF2016303.1 hypothetical protein BU24DRAFT_422648 [Aaosphaeria arxii CBS 175.79]